MSELTDKIKGELDQVVGKAKQALAGDPNDPNRTHADDKLEAEGAGQELKGKGEHVLGSVKGALGDKV